MMKKWVMGIMCAVSFCSMDAGRKGVQIFGGDSPQLSAHSQSASGSLIEKRSKGNPQELRNRECGAPGCKDGEGKKPEAKVNINDELCKQLHRPQQKDQECQLSPCQKIGAFACCLGVMAVQFSMIVYAINNQQQSKK